MDQVKRVVVTGVGAVTPIGNTAEEFWASLMQGTSGIGPITRFDTTGYPTRIAGELKGFESLKYIDKKDDRKSTVEVAPKKISTSKIPSPAKKLKLGGAKLLSSSPASKHGRDIDAESVSSETLSSPPR